MHRRVFLLSGVAVFACTPVNTPTNVIDLDDLVTELETEQKQQNAAPDAYWPSWEQLRDAAVVTRLADS